MSDDGRPPKRPRSSDAYDHYPTAHDSSSRPAPTHENIKKPPGSKKPPLSCAECRRLKLKCDRVFPCQSCCKRGCSEICPDGALTSGRGSRFILANTEKLHDKITQLTERIRQLEDALKELQAAHSDEPHPLLRTDLLHIKTSRELYSAPLPGRSDLSDPALDDRATSSYYRDETAALEDSVRAVINPQPRLEAHPSTALSQQTSLAPNMQPKSLSDLPEDLVKMSASFPVPWQLGSDFRQRIRNLLPPQSEAQALCELARQNAFWQYNIDGSETFLPNLLHHVYNSSIQTLSFRRVALLLMLLAIGTLVDLNQPLGSPRGEMYHVLARVCICETPLMEEPNFDLLRALFYMIWYLIIFSDIKKSVGYAWNIMGLTAKVAQSLNMHRDGAKVKIIPEELEQRRTFFWELLNLDCRLSLSLGLPPSLSLLHVHCRQPSYGASGVYAIRQEAYYHEWKHTFYVQCLNPIVEVNVTSTSVDYPAILALDSAVREFPVPQMLQYCQQSDGSPRYLVMQRVLVSTSRDIALLQLHRTYFTQALSGPEPFTLHHKYAPSVLAMYYSANSVIAAIEALYNQEPLISVRYLGPWFNVFSSSIVLCLLVSRVPSTPLAFLALQDLERACRLFKRVAEGLPFSEKALPIIEKSAEKARRLYLQWRTSTDSEHEPSHQLHVISNTRGSHPSQLQSFKNTHPSLQRHVENINDMTHPPIHQIPAFTAATLPLAHSPSSKYQGASSPQHKVNAFGSQDGHAGALSGLPALLSPLAAPRIADNEAFNFDSGALTDHSYMAWF